MDKDSESEMPAHQNVAETDARILEVTSAMLVSYLNEQAPGVLCFYCKKAEYAVPNDPHGKSAAVITAPVPHIKGLGAWLYMAICPECGHTTTFNAHLVSRKILGS